MPARTSMAALIQRVRDMINDNLPQGSGQIFTDNQIQDWLDRYRLTFRYGILLAQPVVTTGGVLNWSEFYSGYTDWEDSPATVLQGPNYATLTPATADTLTGHWTFNLAVPGQLRPVFIVGLSYDVNRTAASLCQIWAQRVALAYDFSSGVQRFNRSQMAKALRESASFFLSQARAYYAPIERLDEERDAGWPNGNFDPELWSS